MEGLYTIEDFHKNKIIGDGVIQNVEHRLRVANFHEILDNRIEALNVRTSKILWYTIPLLKYKSLKQLASKNFIQ